MDMPEEMEKPSGVLARPDKSLFCQMEADGEIRPTLGRFQGVGSAGDLERNAG
jgi:hypothetical protein